MLLLLLWLTILLCDRVQSITSQDGGGILDVASSSSISSSPEGEIFHHGVAARLVGQLLHWQRQHLLLLLQQLLLLLLLVVGRHPLLLLLLLLSHPDRVLSLVWHGRRRHLVALLPLPEPLHQTPDGLLLRAVRQVQALEVALGGLVDDEGAGLPDGGADVGRPQAAGVGLDAALRVGGVLSGLRQLARLLDLLAELGGFERGGVGFGFGWRAELLLLCGDLAGLVELLAVVGGLQGGGKGGPKGKCLLKFRAIAIKMSKSCRERKTPSKILLSLLINSVRSCSFLPYLVSSSMLGFVYVGAVSVPALMAAPVDVGLRLAAISSAGLGAGPPLVKTPPLLI